MGRGLLVIDVQNEYFTGRLPVTYPQSSLENILVAMDAARETSIPTVVVQHTSSSRDALAFVKNTSGWELHSAIAKRGHDHLIEKNLPGSFTNTDLHSWLGSMDIDSVVICGYMTHMCCDTTARQAMHLGLGVEFLSDATGTLSMSNQAGTVTAEELQRVTLMTQAARFSRVLSTKEWTDLVRGSERS